MGRFPKPWKKGKQRCSLRVTVSLPFLFHLPSTCSPGRTPCWRLFRLFSEQEDGTKLMCCGRHLARWGCLWFILENSCYRKVALCVCLNERCLFAGRAAAAPAAAAFQGYSFPGLRKVIWRKAFSPVIHSFLEAVRKHRASLCWFMNHGYLTCDYIIWTKMRSLLKRLIFKDQRQCLTQSSKGERAGSHMWGLTKRAVSSQPGCD